MAKTSGRLAQGYDYFICQLSKKTKGKECQRHAIKYQDVLTHVETEIRNIIAECLDNNMDYIISKIKPHYHEERLKDLTIKLQDITKKIEQSNQAVTTLYMDKVKGIVTEEEFILIKSNFQDNIKSDETRYKEYSTELDKLKRQMNAADNLETLVTLHANFNKLTFSIVNDFIDYIEIGNKQGDLQEISIHWNI